MINRIKIQNVATYSNPVEIKPKKVNFIYGSNGSGKTTISKLLGNQLVSDDCLIEKNGEENVTVLVYNKQFIEENFQQTDNLKGIFTLGQDSIEAQEKLEILRNENQNKLSSINSKQNQLEGFNDEVERQKNVLVDKCWKLQQSIGESFSFALVGYRNSKMKFFYKCIESYEKWDKNSVVELEGLKSKYDIAYSKDSEIYSLFSNIKVSESLEFETSDLLHKVITGSKDSQIGKVISVLRNSDWVKKGISYMDSETKQCPFCQQKMTEELQQEIKDYFDEAYEIDCQSLNLFIDNYNRHYGEVLDNLKKILETSIPFIDISELEWC